jgi:hypothetical protein
MGPSGELDERTACGSLVQGGDVCPTAAPPPPTSYGAIVLCTTRAPPLYTFNASIITLDICRPPIPDSYRLEC